MVVSGHPLDRGTLGVHSTEPMLPEVRLAGCIQSAPTRQGKCIQLAPPTAQDQELSDEHLAQFLVLMKENGIPGRTWSVWPAWVSWGCGQCGGFMARMGMAVTSEPGVWPGWRHGCELGAWLTWMRIRCGLGGGE